MVDMTLTQADQSILDLLRSQIWFVAVDTDKVLDYVQGMLDTAWRRYQQTKGDDELCWWNVTQWRPKTDPRQQKYPRHDHRMVADALALEGYLEPHQENNGRLSRFRLGRAGLDYAAQNADHWSNRGQRYHFQHYDFQALVADQCGKGYLLLPEPTRAWWLGRIAFEFGGEGRHRMLYDYRPHGRMGRMWERHEDGRGTGYFYNSGSLFKLDDLAARIGDLPPIEF